MKLHYYSQTDVAELAMVAQCTLNKFMRDGRLPEPTVQVGDSRRRYYDEATKDQIVCWFRKRREDQIVLLSKLNNNIRKEGE